MPDAARSPEVSRPREETPANLSQTGDTAAPSPARLSELAEHVTAVQAHTGETALRTLPLPLAVVTLAESAEACVSAIAAQSAQRSPVACRPGCGACCRLAVAVTAPEAVRLAQNLRTRLSPEQLDATLDRIRTTAATISHLSIEDRALARVPCALLGPDDNCTVYDARPIGCRGWTSFSRGACEQALADAEPGHSGPMDAEVWTAATAAAFGIQTAARALRLDAGQYELHSAVLWALEVPGADAAWLRGAPLAERCARDLTAIAVSRWPASRRLALK